MSAANSPVLEQVEGRVLACRVRLRAVHAYVGWIGRRIRYYGARRLVWRELHREEEGSVVACFGRTARAIALVLSLFLFYGDGWRLEGCQRRRSAVVGATIFAVRGRSRSGMECGVRRTGSLGDIGYDCVACWVEDGGGRFFCR